MKVSFFGTQRSQVRILSLRLLGRGGRNPLFSEGSGFFVAKNLENVPYVKIQIEKQKEAAWFRPCRLLASLIRIQCHMLPVDEGQRVTGIAEGKLISSAILYFNGDASVFPEIIGSL